MGAPSTRGCKRSWITSPQTSPPIMTCRSREGGRALAFAVIPPLQAGSRRAGNGGVIQLRLNQAARLLEHTVDDIGAIAREVGFGSPYYFSRQFRRHFGMSPRRYRAKPGDVCTDSKTYPADRFWLEASSSRRGGFPLSRE